MEQLKVGEKDRFVFAAAGLEHGHINGMVNGLLKAGGCCKWVWDPDSNKVKAFLETFPQAKAARCLEEVLEDNKVRMVAAAAIPADRCALGVRVMESGKDYFTAKTPLTTLAQLEQAKAACIRTGRRYFCYFSERLQSECALYAGELVKKGAIGRVIQVLGLGPHRLTAASRPEWFFKKRLYGGILCDIGSHQIEQFLYFTGAEDAQIVRSQIANYAHPETPELDDFGDAMLVADNGASGYFRVDWFTPDGLSTWGDGRTVILGTDGYIELRKNLNVATDPAGDHLFLVDKSGEHHLEASGKVGYPFFNQMIRDSLDGTETAMTQAHIFKAAELCVRAQNQAVRLS